jgi:hypothetical protein
MRTSITYFLGLTATVLGALADTTKVETSEASLPSTVQTQTYEKDGKVVTDRVTTTQVLDRQVVSKIPGTYKAAIFVANRLKDNQDLTQPFEDLVTGRVTDRGFQVLSKEVVADSMRTFDPTLAATARPADSLDTKLSEQSSSLRLSQGLGADYLLIVSLSSIGEKQRSVDAYGVKQSTTETTLRFTYKVIDGGNGATLTADSDKVSVDAQQSENATEKNDDAMNELMDQAATKIADSLTRRIEQQRIPAASVADSVVTITINIEAGDLVVPDVRLDADNTISISEGHYKVAPLNATVELDGVAVGTAPGTVSVHKGFSKLRITHEGFKTWQQTINAVNGQVLTVPLVMDDAGYARWKDATAFLNDLKNGAKLTDAEAEKLKGEAKMFSQSGYKVDTKNAPATNIFR